eukprot:scaffold108468_cov63-Phaeocystis_antarctica.AAC.2
MWPRATCSAPAHAASTQAQHQHHRRHQGRSDSKQLREPDAAASGEPRLRPHPHKCLVLPRRGVQDSLARELQRVEGQHLHVQGEPIACGRGCRLARSRTHGGVGAAASVRLLAFATFATGRAAVRLSRGLHPEVAVHEVKPRIARRPSAKPSSSDVARGTAVLPAAVDAIAARVDDKVWAEAWKGDPHVVGEQLHKVVLIVCMVEVRHFVARVVAARSVRVGVAVGGEVRCR